MLSKKMEEALNAQVNAEFWSAYLYLSFESRKDLYAYYVQHPEIKVINNSWGTGCYLTNIDDNQAYELVQSWSSYSYRQPGMAGLSL